MNRGDQNEKGGTSVPDQQNELTRQKLGAHLWVGEKILHGGKLEKKKTGGEPVGNSPEKGAQKQKLSTSVINTVRNQEGKKG